MHSVCVIPVLYIVWPQRRIKLVHVFFSSQTLKRDETKYDDIGSIWKLFSFLLISGTALIKTLAFTQTFAESVCVLK